MIVGLGQFSSYHVPGSSSAEADDGLEIAPWFSAITYLCDVKISAVVVRESERTNEDVRLGLDAQLPSVMPHDACHGEFERFVPEEGGSPVQKYHFDVRLSRRPDNLRGSNAGFDCGNADFWLVDGRSNSTRCGRAAGHRDRNRPPVSRNRAARGCIEGWTLTDTLHLCEWGGSFLPFPMRIDSHALRERLEMFRRSQIFIDGFSRAAVLVPLLQVHENVEVLLTRRTDEVDTHKGQISFPGGMIEASDPSPEHAALREAEEELGLAPSAVTTIGLLDDHATPTGFVITPVVGLLHGIPPLAPNPREVAEVLRLPLAFFADRTKVRREQREFRGQMHDVWFYDTGTHVIWGATAAMIRSLLQRLGML